MRTPTILGCSSAPPPPPPATVAATGLWWETAPAAGGCPRRLRSGHLGVFPTKIWFWAKIKSCNALVSSGLRSIHRLNRAKREAEVCSAAPNFSKERQHLPAPAPWLCPALRKATPTHLQKTLRLFLQQAHPQIHP